MKKVSKNKNKINVIKIIVLLLILLLIALVGFGISKLFSKPFYSVESRIDKLDEVIKKNPKYEITGWLKVQGTNIDIPLVYNDGTFPLTGVLDNYAWTNSNLVGDRNKISIFGHNIRNLSSTPDIANKEHERFEQLPSFLYYDFAKDNKYIQYTVDNTDRLYKIFSVSIVENRTIEAYNRYYTKDKMSEYINKSLQDSYYKYDLDVNENDEVITLSTCTRFFGPTSKYTFKIDARRVRPDEKITDYDVSKKDNYNKIKEILRGVEKNEI